MERGSNANGVGLVIDSLHDASLQPLPQSLEEGVHDNRSSARHFFIVG